MSRSSCVELAYADFGQHSQWRERDQRHDRRQQGVSALGVDSSYGGQEPAEPDRNVPFRVPWTWLARWLNCAYGEGCSGHFAYVSSKVLRRERKAGKTTSNDSRSRSVRLHLRTIMLIKTPTWVGKDDCQRRPIRFTQDFVVNIRNGVTIELLRGGSIRPNNLGYGSIYFLFSWLYLCIFFFPLFSLFEIYGPVCAMCSRVMWHLSNLRGDCSNIITSCWLSRLL